MAKHRRRTTGPKARSEPARNLPGRRGLWAAILGFVAVVAVVVVAYAGLSNGSSGSWLEQGRGGSWTNVSADTLAGMLEDKDFTLVNVKTPYIGEIADTDLYIPYTELTARASELPADHAARILVYCRSGNESRIAAQTLLDLGYTNVWNLDRGMESWVASGRSLIQKVRT
jgi:rhodanese-related sulfurtransferase